MFENFISLGWFCGTAASMSKYGIRSVSGPFDWYFNDFKGVLACMENDFADFLDKRNLEMIVGRPGEFMDAKYGFHFNHEVKTCFEAEFDSIYQKYEKRIKKFKEMIGQKTCFIRAVREESELKYIQENREAIQKIIKKCNSENEIIYIVSSKEIKIVCENLEFPFFVVESMYDGASRKGLRSLFDKNIDLEQFLVNNFDENYRYRNLYFDLQKENQILEQKADKYDLMMCIDAFDVSKSITYRKIIIYGAGIVGKYLWCRIKEQYKVLYFIDEYSDEKLYENTPIINMDDYLKQGCFDVPIIITTYYYDIVQTELAEIGASVILSINDFLNGR